MNRHPKRIRETVASNECSLGYAQQREGGEGDVHPMYYQAGAFLCEG
jgi:hypothetical protein